MDGSSAERIEVQYLLDGKPSKKVPKRKKRDPNQPAGYISGFNFFAKDARPRLLIEYPKLKESGATNNEINKLIGKLWKSLPLKFRTIYEQRSWHDKLRYLEEMKQYCPTDGFKRKVPRIRPVDAPPRPVDLPKSFANRIAGTSIDYSACDKKNPGDDGKPESAYSVFFQQEYSRLLPQMTSKYTSLESTCNITTMIAERWKAMCDDEKKLYDDIHLAGMTQVLKLQKCTTHAGLNREHAHPMEHIERLGHQSTTSTHASPIASSCFD